MGVPKRRTSKTRRDKRRTHQKLSAASLSVCPQCNELKLPHRVCPSCGTYKGRTVLPMKEE